MTRIHRHKVFVSYHHGNDQRHRNRFERLFSDVYDIMDSRSVRIEDIPRETNVSEVSHRIRDDYLSDSTVTVVLIETDTWRRKHIDWEIAASIRDTDANDRSGLVGIFRHIPTMGMRSMTPTPSHRGCTTMLSADTLTFMTGLNLRPSCELDSQCLQPQEGRDTGQFTCQVRQELEG